MKGFGGIAIALLAAAALFAFSGLGKRRDGVTADDARAEIARSGPALPSSRFGEIFQGLPTRDPLRLPQPGIHFDDFSTGVFDINAPGNEEFKASVMSPFVGTPTVSAGINSIFGTPFRSAGIPSLRTPIVPGVPSTVRGALSRPPVGSQVVVGASGRAIGFRTPEGVQQRRTLDLVLTQTGLAPFLGANLEMLAKAAQTNQLAKDVLAAAARLEMEILDGK